MTDDVERNHAETDIAIVGMAGRFPGARTPAELWANVRRGVESIRPVTDDELRAGGVDPAVFQRPDYVKVSAPLDDMELFDSGFFGFSPRDADIMDPQHRHFLECAWEALEDAGHMPEAFPGSIGVFGGCGMNGYFMFNLLTNPSLVSNVGLFLLRHTGNDKDFLTTRVSYLLNLTGPSLGVQTACSTSLVAIHVASQHLLSGECDLALAGGVTIELPHRVGYLYQEGEILSPDGHCRSFDASSKGTVFGSGAGVVALRRLADAIRDGDVIHAIIKGSAVNNDGATKIGYLAPSVDGQASSILEALSVAGVNASSISYVETHGTGTPVGDPIEIAALTQAFRAHTPRSGFCAIGSLKSNIGHLDTAAGVASLIKVVHALKHRELPPSLHFEKPNPSIDFASTPFWVNTTLRPWAARPGTPRLAGVSSLGVGGTNAHVILEEPPVPVPAPADAARPYNVLLLSARTMTSLDAFTSKLARHFAEAAEGAEAADGDGGHGTNVTDAAYTLAVGRRAFEERRVVVCRDAADAATALTALDTSRTLTGSRGNATPSVVMLFPGGGAQHPDMARDLYRDEPVFKKEVDRCLAICDRLGHGHLRDLMYPAEFDRERAAKELEQPANSVLSVFVIEYALATLWMSWGVKPAAMIGHSLGEYTAACLAGVMSLQDALALVSTRGRLFERVPEGAMLSVALPEQELAALPAMADLAIAAVNAPELAVASGPVGTIDALAADLAARGIDARRLHINVAAHSPMLDAIAGEFEAFANTIRFRPPTLPYISNVTGTWADPAVVTTGKYWASHLRSTVRFSAGIMTLLAERGRVFLEVGPGQTLSSLTRMHRGPDGAAPAVAASLRHSQDHVSDHQPLHLALGRLWMQGCAIDWTAYFGQDRRRVSLPTYAFDRKRHWIAPGTGSFQAGAHDSSAPAALSEPRAIERVTDVAAWAHSPVWKPASRPAAAPLHEHAHTWLVFADAETKAGAGARTSAIDRFGGDVVSRLTSQRQRVIVVLSGDSYGRAADGTYRVRPDERGDYVSLVKDLAAREALPDRVMHLWLARGTNSGNANAAPAAHVTTNAGTRVAQAAARQALGFGSLMALTQALGEHDPEHALHLTIVTRGAARVKDEPIAYPEDATVLGPVRVIPREYPGLQYQAVDLAMPDDSRGDAKAGDLAARLIEQAAAATADPLVALRDDGLWTPEYQRVPLPAASAEAVGPALRDGGVYVVTGGTGGIGQVLATHLAGQHRAKLALIARTPLPETSPFLQSLQDAGATVLSIAADVTNTDAMRTAIARVRETFGGINGVFHAAGIVDDGLVQMKERESSARVLAPKVAGTLALDAALEGVQLDFFVLFSSTSAALGFVGQADYSAANAFLNAFARWRSAHAANGGQAGHGHTVAINWGIWQDTGMTARLGGAGNGPSAGNGHESPSPRLRGEGWGEGQDAASATTTTAAAAAPVHPLLGARVSSNPDRVIYEAEYTSSTPWVLDEHRLTSGLAIVPGTAFIEMALSAWADMTGDARVQIDDLLFLAPLEVPDGTSRRVRHTLQREDGGAWRFVTESVPSGGGNGNSRRAGDDEWTEQARATLRQLDEATLASSSPDSSSTSSASSTLGLSGRYALDVIRAEATDAITPGSGTPRDVWTKQGRHLRFGPRWNTLRSLHVGSSTAVATLSLNETYHADLDEYGAHPALLDLATACGLAAVPRYEDTDDVFVPFSYKRIRISPLPATVTAVARVAADANATHDAVVLDVDLLNDQGEIVAAIEEFTLRRIAPARLEAAEVARAAAEVNAANRRASAARTPLETLVAQGIRPAEGMDALTRALDARLGPEVMLSSIDLAPLMAFVDRAYPRGRITSARDTSSAAATATSGDMNDTERAIAEMWRDLLGADRIGLDDDFFALGGHSLIAVRLASRIEKQFKTSMRLSVLFEAPTIRKLAAMVRQGKPAAAQWQALTPMRTAGTKEPLFCVHGVGGEVLSYTALVAALDPERPFYAFRAPGHDGEHEPLKDIQSQAALYVKELRTFRPEGPYYLAGYSHGGRVAFEMAQQLLAQGQQVAFLGIIDTWPSEDWPMTPAYIARWLRNLPLWLANDFAQSSAEANKNRVRRGLRLVNRVVRKLTTPFGGRKHDRHVTDHINIALLPDAIQRSYEANYHAFISYKPVSYSGRATVFRASAQPLLAPLERDHGWGRFVRGGVTVVPIPGNHTTILNLPLVRELAAALERALEEAERLSVAAAPAAGTSTAKSPQPGSRKTASLPALP